MKNFTPYDDSRFYHASFKGLFDMKVYGMSAALMMELSGYHNNGLIFCLAIGSYIGGFAYGWMHHDWY